MHREKVDNINKDKKSNLLQKIQKREKAIEENLQKQREEQDRKMREDSEKRKAMMVEIQRF